MKSATKIISVCLFLLVILTVILYTNFGKILERTIEPSEIYKFVKSQNGLELTVEKLEFKTKSNLRLKISFDELKLMTPEKKELLALGKSNLEIKILPLISKKVVIRKFNSESAKISILRDKNGKYEFEKYFNPKNKPAFTVDFKKGKIVLNSYEADLQDDFQNIKSEFSGQKFVMQNAENLFELSTNGKINTTLKNQKKPEVSTFEIDLKTRLPYKKYLAGKDFKFNVNIDNLDIAQYSNYLKIFNKDWDEIKGVLNIKILTNDNKINSAITIKNFEITGEKFNVKIDPAASGETKIDSIVYLNPNFIEIDHFNLLNKNIDINASGKILDYKSKEQKIDLKVGTRNTNGKAIIALLPNLIPTPENTIFKLKKYNVDGTLNGNIELSGNLKKPQINGSVEAREITILNKTLKIPPSHGSVAFSGNNVNINVRAFLGTGKYIDVKGSTRLYSVNGSKGSAFHITSVKNIDLKTAQITVLPISDIFGFNLGPVPIMDLAGTGSIDLKTAGTKNNAKLNGYLEFNNAKASINGFNTPLEQAVGKIYFKDNKIQFNDINAKMNTADVEINGIAYLDGNVEMKFQSKNLNNKDIFRICRDNFDKNLMKKIEPLENIKFQTAFTLGFKNNFDKTDTPKNINLKDLNFAGSAVGINSKDSDIVWNSGELYLKNNKLYVDKLDFTVLGANILADFTTDKVMDTIPKYAPVTNGKISLKNFPLQKLNEGNINFNSGNFNKVFSAFKDFEGNLGGILNINKNNLSGKIDLEGISVTDRAKNVVIKINSGNVEAKNNRLLLNALNLNYGAIPVYLNAVVSDINSQNPFLDAHFSTSLSENDVDKFINTNLVYPVKVKGEVSAKGMLKGLASNYSLYLKIGLDPQNDISYMGANFGETDLRRELKASMNFKENVAKINNFEYLKYVSSQNNKLTPVTILKTFGDIVLKDDKAALRNFNIKTQNPATARIFNIIFKKSILKQGQFNCDLVLNGIYDDLKIIGSIDFTDVNIPLYNSKIRDARINFTNDLIRADLSGRGFESDIKIAAEIENNLKLPVIIKKMDITSSKINIGKIIDDLSSLPTSQKPGNAINAKEQIVLNPKDLIIEHGVASAAEVNLYDINAKNFAGKFNHLANSPFKFYDTAFEIANGTIVSEGTFDFETTKLILDSRINNCEANVLSQSFLGISNQLYGNANGEIYLTGSKLNTQNGLKTVEARAMFEVQNGKMPKLGSMEYLLRAGNIYKSGILGLTINNVIDVLIPYKTGEFDTIKGLLVVQSGIVEKLEISSKGENLSIFINGKYDLVNNSADIQVFGRLSKKISNLLGPIGNASVNSLIGILSGKKTGETPQNELVQNINKIPLIEISQNDYRLFLVKIMGDLNQEGYVKTFNWLN